MKKLTLFLVITTLVTFESLSQVQYNGTSVTGTDASAIGIETISSSDASFASGIRSEATGMSSTALGYHAFAFGNKSTALGSMVKSSEYRSFVIGSGEKNANIILENSIPSSLMIGFNSKFPTLFVSSPENQDADFSKTGKIGIGYITNPLAKLHIKSDEGEEASILIEPNNWELGEFALLNLGNQNFGISASKTFGLLFSSESNFSFEGLNAGFGVEDPKAKVHINGDLLFEQSINGIIFKSEDGNCWKGTMSNDGELVFNQIDCETLSSNNNLSEKRNKNIFIYPNPSNGELTIDYTGNENQIIVEINTITGVLVKTMKVNKGENKIYLNDISDQIVILNSYTLKGEWISTNKILLK